MATLWKTSLLITLSLLSSSTLCHSCHPHDSKILLQIKTHFNNVDSFNSWVPNTDCCTWSGVGCNDQQHPDRVTFLSVYGTNIAGEIPPIIGDLTYLTVLDMFGLPNLTGPIPRTISKLTKLQFLILSANNLTGPIPEIFSPKFKSLTHVDLSSNSFSGTIPASLSLLPNIVELDLLRNKLTGSIPEGFGSIKTNLALLAYENQLSGPIPRSLTRVNFSVLDVSNNQLTGDASFLFGKVKGLQQIKLTQNKFKFDFTNVDLPQGLRGLEIAHNQIYGSLPKRLGQLPLNTIDISYNKLCGPIPKGRRLKQFSPTAFAHNKCLCDPPLSPCMKSNPH